MTAATIERIKKELTAARARGDGREIARLYFSLPLSERNEPVVRPGGRVGLHGASHLPYDARPDRHAQTSTWPTVSIDPSAFQALRNVGFEGRETAGFLVGREIDGCLEILDFFEAYNRDNNTWGSVYLDLERGLSILGDLPLDRTIVGAQHQHPDGAGVQPSNQDLAAGASLAKSFERPHWVEIITSVPASRWAIKTDVGAYLIRPDGNHRVVEITEARSY